MSTDEERLAAGWLIVDPAVVLGRKESRMSEMIERVAEAIRKIELSQPGAGGLKGSLHLAGYASREIARAAIEAMREPTEEMVAKVVGLDGVVTSRSAWRAMIDAALGKSEFIGSIDCFGPYDLQNKP